MNRFKLKRSDRFRHTSTCLLAALLLSGCDSSALSKQRLAEFEFHEPRPLPEAVLTDQNGEPFDLRAEGAGKITFLFFGFTSCPDICPLTMVNMARAAALLEPAEREEVLIVFVTLDPPRDSPEQIALWLGGIDPSFVGLTGTQAEVNEVLGQMGYSMPSVPRPESGNYDVPHPATVFVFTRDALGRYGYPVGSRPPETIAEDLRTLIAMETS